MASSLFEKERAKKFRVFRNGDPLFLGKDVVINRQHAKSWDIFLEKLTVDLRNPDAVRDLCTPTGGTPIRSFDDIEDRQNYVAVGRTKFKDIGYLNLGEQHTQQMIGPKKTADQYSLPLKSVRHTAIDNRPKLYESTNADVNCIFVFTNGDHLQPAKRIKLTKRSSADLNLLMTEISQQVKLNSGAARLLYTIDGKLIYEPSQQLENRGQYVAVGSEFGGFKQLNYGSITKPAFSTSTTNKKGNRKLDTYRGTRHYNGSHGNDSSSTSASSSIPADVWKSNRRGVTKSHEVESNARMYRYVNNRLEYVRHSVENDSPRRDPFHAQPRPADRTGHQTYRNVDYDQDEGGIFKSKKLNHERADQVQENYETRVDLPVDRIKAQQIEDEDEGLTPRRRVAAVNGHASQHRQPKQLQARQPQHQHQQQPLPRQTVKQGQTPRLPMRQHAEVDRRVDDDVMGDNEDDDERVRNHTKAAFERNKKAGGQGQQRQGQGQIRRPLYPITNGHGSDTARSMDNDDDGEITSRQTGGNGKQQQEKKVQKRLDVIEPVSNGQRRGKVDRVATPREEPSPRFSPESKPKTKTKKNTPAEMGDDRTDSERNSEAESRHRGIVVAKNGVWDDERSQPVVKKKSQQNGHRDEESDDDEVRRRKPHHTNNSSDHSDDLDEHDGHDTDGSDKQRSKRRPVMAITNRKQLDNEALTKTIKRAVKETKNDPSDDEDDIGKKNNKIDKGRPKATADHEELKPRNGVKDHDEDSDDDRVVRKQAKQKQGQVRKKVTPMSDDNEDERIVAEDGRRQMTIHQKRKGMRNDSDSEDRPHTARSEG